jgi:predicted P-loop ATPase
MIKMAEVRILKSTGNEQEDAKLFSEVKDSLTNKTTFEEAKEREREANVATATGTSHNALTEQPRIEGQTLAVVVDETVEPTEKVNGGQTNNSKPVLTEAERASFKQPPVLTKVEERPADISK